MAHAALFKLNGSKAFLESPGPISAWIGVAVSVKKNYEVGRQKFVTIINLKLALKLSHVIEADIEVHLAVLC